MPETLNSFDVAIAGGGMAGSALACALGAEGIRVALVETREPQREWPPEEVDLRVSALTRATQNILKNLGAWKQMQAYRITPYREMQVWDAGGNGSIHFSAADIGEPDLGHIVENRITRLGLWQRLEELESVTRFCPNTVATVDLAGPVVTLDDGTRIEAQLLVGADGRDSRIRDMAGITTRGWGYDQHALVATVTPERHHRESCWQRFMPTGPLAFLPIDDGRCSIVWSTHPDHANELLALDEAGFCEALTETSEHLLGRITAAGPRAAFPLRLQHADNYVKPGLALVADAAHAMHPLAGQGINLGLLDVCALAEVLVDAHRARRSLGSLATLRRYERGRKGANLEMLGAMDGFKKLFSNDNPALTLIRNMGLSLTDAAVPAKHLIMRRALGQIGELPRLALPGGTL